MVLSMSNSQLNSRKKPKQKSNYNSRSKLISRKMCKNVSCLPESGKARSERERETEITKSTCEKLVYQRNKSKRKNNETEF